MNRPWIVTVNRHTKQYEPDTYLIENFLIQGGVMMFSAQPKAGKSQLAAKLAADFSLGRPFFGQAPRWADHVLYVAGERES